MDRPLTPEDVLGPKPTTTVLLRRGFRKKCPRCGGGHLYRGWFRMAERCPTCGYLFEREPGFFIGAYFVNFAITEGLLFVMLMAWIVVLGSNGGDVRVAPILAIGVVLAVAAPVAFYPFSRTIWSAIDLAMSPMELKEIVDAEDAVHGLPRTPPADGRQPSEPGEP